MKQITLSCGNITETALVSTGSVLYMLSKYSNTIEDIWAIKVMQYCNNSLSFSDLENDEKKMLLEKIIYYNINPNIEEDINDLFSKKETETNLCNLTLYNIAFDNQFKTTDADIASDKDTLWESIIYRKAFRRYIATDGTYYIIDNATVLSKNIKYYCENNKFIISKNSIDNSIQFGEYYICCNTENIYKSYSIYPDESAVILYELIDELNEMQLKLLDKFYINYTYFEMIVNNIKYSNGILQLDFDYIDDMRHITCDELTAQEYIILVPEILKSLCILADD